MEPIDHVVFSKRPRKPKGELTLFPEAARFIKLSSPSPNSSFETGKDMLMTQTATYIRSEVLENSIKKHDSEPGYAVKAYMDIFGLEYEEKYIEQVIEESAILIKEQKNKFNRPRPSQLAPYFALQLKLQKSKTAKTPSYPSGHSAQAYLLAEIYGEKYPTHRKNLLKAAEECGAGRIAAGLHFPSDHKAGIYLAKRLFRSMKRSKTENTVQYDTVFTLSTPN